MLFLLPENVKWKSFVVTQFPEFLYHEEKFGTPTRSEVWLASENFNSTFCSACYEFLIKIFKFVGICSSLKLRFDSGLTCFSTKGIFSFLSRNRWHHSWTDPLFNHLVMSQMWLFWDANLSSHADLRKMAK